MPVVCGLLPCAAWVAGGRFVRRRSSRASGGMSGRRPRKVVVLVDAQGATEQRYVGAAAPNVCHLRGCLTLGRLGDKVTLGGGLGRQRQWRWAWFGCCKTVLVGSVPACPNVFRLASSCCEVEAAFGWCTMTFEGRFDGEGPFRRRSCASPLRGSSSESELPAFSWGAICLA
jgi:hypothetical protein